MTARWLGLLVGLLLCLAVALGVSFTQSPVVNNNLPTFTDDDLVCTWNDDGDVTSVNVTWYQEGSPYSSVLDSSAPFNTSSTISSSATTKNEEWVCEVTLSNSSTSTTQQDNVTVQNSAPETPIIYNTSGEDVGTSVAVTEDATTLLDANSSDIDGDTLTYYFKSASFCTVTNSANGETSCTPNHDDVINASGDEVLSQKFVTFWVDDDDVLFAKSASKTVTFNITPVNDAPNVTIPNQTTNVTATFNTTFTGVDEESNHPLNVSVVTALTSTNISDDVSATMDDNTTIRFVYETDPTEYEDVGNHTVTLNLSDALGEWALYNFTLEITTVSRKPYLVNITPPRLNSPTNGTFIVNQSDYLEINITVNDPDTTEGNETITFDDNTSMFDIQTVTPLATNTTDAKGRINFTPGENDIGVNLVNITFEDQAGVTNWTLLNITVLNLNDPPSIINESYDSRNTGSNVDINHLQSYLNAPFVYYVNATDPDLPYGDTLNYSDNTSTFNITSTGRIAFTPTGQARNETVNITVEDTAGLADWRSIQLEVINNSAPYFNQSFPTLVCNESIQCTFDVSAWSKDDDGNISQYTASLSPSLGTFSMNQTSGLISFTPLQSEIGNYTASITIRDEPGATATQDLNITIINTEDTPIWTRYNLSRKTIVENKTLQYRLEAVDPDLALGGRNVSFSSNFSFSIQWLSIVNDTAQALLTWTPNATDIGNHTVHLNATDETNRTNSTTLTIEVLAATDPPVIRDIRPHGDADDNLTEEWIDVGNASNPEPVSFAENTTGVLFGANATDDNTSQAELQYIWYYDGAHVESITGTKTRSFDFDFQSSGTHNLTVVVNDTTLENDMWSWLLTIANVNRPPLLQNDLDDELSVDSTTTYADYLRRTNGQNHYYDPDDDLDDSGIIDGNESSSLTYSVTECGVASIEFIDDSIKVTPESQGSCSVRFTAQDAQGSTTNQSNLVTITVTDVPDTETTITESSGGGGGGSSSRSELVPFEQEVDKPKPFTILTPQNPTIYENGSISIPVTIKSNWSEPLEDIELSADANQSGVRLFFDQSTIPQLEPNETAEVELTAIGYRLGDNFEVTVKANVTEPQFEDSALVLFNAIEQTIEERGVGGTDVKVTFARDLLSENSECQELRPLLDEAQAMLERGETAEAARQLEKVIKGCKYLISRQERPEQQPGVLTIGDFTLSDELLRTVAIYGAVGLTALILLGIWSYHRTSKRYDF